MRNVSRRRLVCVMPLEAIIGKIAPSKERVSKSNPGFKCFVGYQRGTSLFNRYQVKTHGRQRAFDDMELSNQQKFKIAQKNARAALLDPEKYAQLTLAFSKQTKYSTLYGYTFAQEYAKLS